MKKFYTFKNIDNDLLTQNQKNKNRAILRIATKNGELSKASQERFEMARKIYNTIKKLNKLREYELDFDSCFNSLMAKSYGRKQDELYNKIKSIEKELDLKIECGTWWHVMTLNNQTIYFS